MKHIKPEPTVTCDSCGKAVPAVKAVKHSESLGKPSYTLCLDCDHTPAWVMLLVPVIVIGVFALIAWLV